MKHVKLKEIKGICSAIASLKENSVKILRLNSTSIDGSLISPKMKKFPFNSQKEIKNSVIIINHNGYISNPYFIISSGNKCPHFLSLISAFITVLPKSTALILLMVKATVSWNITSTYQVWWKDHSTDAQRQMALDPPLTIKGTSSKEKWGVGRPNNIFIRWIRS